MPHFRIFDEKAWFHSQTIEIEQPAREASGLKDTGDTGMATADPLPSEEITLGYTEVEWTYGG